MMSGNSNLYAGRDRMNRYLHSGEYITTCNSAELSLDSHVNNNKL
jgi:hypothetical protein